MCYSTWFMSTKYVLLYMVYEYKVCVTVHGLWVHCMCYCTWFIIVENVLYDYRVVEMMEVLDNLLADQESRAASRPSEMRGFGWSEMLVQCFFLIYWCYLVIVCKHYEYRSCCSILLFLWVFKKYSLCVSAVCGKKQDQTIYGLSTYLLKCVNPKRKLYSCLICILTLFNMNKSWE